MTVHPVTILSVAFSDPEQRTIAVREAEREWIAPWPADGWLGDAVAGWLASGNEIAPHAAAPADYRAARARAYLPVPEQLDLLFADMEQGSTRWRDHIRAVKAAHPKPVETRGLARESESPA